ncbi:MAG: GNAT family protein [Bacilli bacterium]|nr:GNAT family protein [Bacilli bacterium]
MKNRLLISLLPLETKRLIIRATTTDDVDMILKMDKQEITQTFLGGIKNNTREERIVFLEKKVKSINEGYIDSLTVCLKDGTPIGFIAIKIKEINNNAEISYIVDADYCNKGYCTEACKKILNIGFNKLKLNKIYANTIENNYSSKRVLEKLGFKLEGIRRESAYIQSLNEYKDFLDYGILKKEYK